MYVFIHLSASLYKGFNRLFTKDYFRVCFEIWILKHIEKI